MAELKNMNTEEGVKIWGSKTAPKSESSEEVVTTRILTEGQELAYTAILDFVNGDRKQFLLEGYAGTGKTFLMFSIIEDLLKTNINIAITATTNKAVKVIAESLGTLAQEVASLCTIHSLLGLKEKVGANGEITFEPDRNAPRKIDEVNFVIVDESSMLPDELFSECFLYTKKGVKFLFVGDGKQIPPVGKTCSIPFSNLDRETYNIGYAMLTEIVRQKNGNPIIELSKQIRERPMYQGSLKDLYPDGSIIPGAGIAYLPTSDTHSLYSVMQKLYTNPKFKENADFVKTVAWRNNTVDRLNARIRSYYLPDASETFVVGDKLLANTPIVENVEDRVIVIYTTNDEFEVSEVSTGSVVRENVEFKVYILATEYVLLNGKTVTRHIQVIHDDSEALLIKVAKDLKNAAISSKDNPKVRSELWTRYYGLMKTFADVKYNYCLTAHKSQGSTYQNCIVIEDDINVNPNIPERNKIKYTAITRAAKRLIIVG